MLTIYIIVACVILLGTQTGVWAEYFFEGGNIKLKDSIHKSLVLILAALGWPVVPFIAIYFALTK